MSRVQRRRSAGPPDRPAGHARPSGPRLPAQVVGGSIADAEAAWRGAFLAHGSLTEPGRPRRWRSAARPEAALALVEAARRLGVSAKVCEARGTDRRGPRRRGHRHAAHPDGRPGHPAGLGRNGGCAVRSAPPRTGWPTSTMPTRGARLAPRQAAAARERALEIPGDGVPITRRGGQTSGGTPAGLRWRNWAGLPNPR